MLFSASTVVRFAGLIAAMALPREALAQSFERPPSFEIEKIAGFWPTGDNYTIKNPVRSDGLLRIYTLTTPYGEFTVHGDQMLRMRLNELAALHELEKIANSESYGKSLVEAGLSPFRYTGRLIADPKKTVGDTFSGIGTMFGRISSDLANVGKNLIVVGIIRQRDPDLTDIWSPGVFGQIRSTDLLSDRTHALDLQQLLRKFCSYPL